MLATIRSASPERIGRRPNPSATASRRRWFSAALIALMLICGLAGPQFSAAAADTAAAGQFIENLGTKVVGILKNETSSAADRQTNFKALFVDNFDALTIGRFVLGRHWRELNAEQRAQFVTLFSDYVAALYAAQFSRYQGQTLKVAASRPVGGDDISVESLILQPNSRTPLHVNFRVHQQSSGFKVVDVSVDNVSLIITKRSEFNSIIQSEGIDGLMQRMRQALQRIGHTAAADVSRTG